MHHGTARGSTLVSDGHNSTVCTATLTRSSTWMCVRAYFTDLVWKLWESFSLSQCKRHRQLHNLNLPLSSRCSPIDALGCGIAIVVKS